MAKTALSEAMPDIEFEVDDISYEPQTLASLSGDDQARLKPHLPNHQPARLLLTIS